MARANLNKLAREITLVEGLEKSISIAQVKEVLGILGERWRDGTVEQMAAEVSALVSRAGRR